MADKGKKKQVILRKRVPQVVREHRRRRGLRWQGQASGAIRYLNSLHGIFLKEAEEAPEVRELIEAKQPAQPIFHGTPRLYLAGLKDLNFTINGQCRQEGRIACRWTVRAVHSSELLGAPATGREVTFSGATLTALEGEHLMFKEEFRTELGKVFRQQWAFWVVEEWNYWDLPGLVAQLRQTRQAVGEHA